MFYCCNNNFNPFSFESMYSPSCSNFFFANKRVTVVDPYIQIAIHQQVRAMEQMILINYLATFLLLNALSQSFQRESFRQDSTHFSWKNYPSSTFSSSNQYETEEQPIPNWTKNFQQNASKPQNREEPKFSQPRTARFSSTQNNSPILATSTLTGEEAKLCQNYKNEFLRKIEVENPEKVPFSKVDSTFKKQCLKKKWHSDKNKTSDAKFIEANEYKDQYYKKMQPYAETNKDGSNIVLDTNILSELDSYFKL